jgi:hypothetical protein
MNAWCGIHSEEDIVEWDMALYILISPIANADFLELESITHPHFETGAEAHQVPRCRA